MGENAILPIKHNADYSKTRAGAECRDIIDVSLARMASILQQK